MAASRPSSLVLRDAAARAPPKGGEPTSNRRAAYTKPEEQPTRTAVSMTLLCQPPAPLTRDRLALHRLADTYDDAHSLGHALTRRRRRKGRRLQL